ncbi:TIGR03790 family protein [Massilia soli]|uniref:TIGR03790 family protein n=1 Tax=Massilia soli TaxID=2792854 RepID=A0ABS7SKX2_9BURK|nr:TIGR03790 family protein [Massilia soli]MBZ2206841.1 TIGR03790 family protein [Massilia soli]
MRLRVTVTVFLCLAGMAHAAHAQFKAAPRARLTPSQLAIVINDDDPNSVAVGAYYRKVRDIPHANVVHVNIPNRPQRLDAAQFAVLKKDIDRQLGAGIEAVLMIWTAPYAVECNAITSAFTLGFDAAQCLRSCAPGRPSKYFNSAATQPYTQDGMRLSMLLPTESVPQAKAVIDRGVAAGFRVLPATAYFMVTSDAARNARARFYPPPARLASRKIATRVVKADVLEGADDIIIYQTGMRHVGKLDTLGFRPGALADHLTSLGGDLLGQSQMSSLRWLEAGATASYGTVSEPCNHWQKFPHPAILLKHYVGGASAIEAYWKSVAWPAQGLFIGEPLATPYRR